MVKYQTHLESKEWKQTRRSTMARVKSKSRRAVFQCEMCQEFFNTDAIQVHHKHYRTVGSERSEDLMVVCRWCHAETHGKQDFALLAATDTKESYRIRFLADRKTISDGEMNHARNEFFSKLPKD
jgi:5-methylcytosine-specific restriction endonuclease McrA